MFGGTAAERGGADAETVRELHAKIGERTLEQDFESPIVDP